MDGANETDVDVVLEQFDCVDTWHVACLQEVSSGGVCRAGAFYSVTGHLVIRGEGTWRHCAVVVHRSLINVVGLLDFKRRFPWVCLRGLRQTWIMSAHLPHSGYDIQDFVDSCNELVEFHKKEGRKVIGLDANVELGNLNFTFPAVVGEMVMGTSNSRSNIFVECCMAMEMVVGNTKRYGEAGAFRTTHVQKGRSRRASQRDFVLWSGPWSEVKEWRILMDVDLNSDHFAVLVTVDFQTRAARADISTRRRRKGWWCSDKTKFQLELHEKILELRSSTATDKLELPDLAGLLQQLGNKYCKRSFGVAFKTEFDLELKELERRRRLTTAGPSRLDLTRQISRCRRRRGEARQRAVAAAAGCTGKVGEWRKRHAAPRKPPTVLENVMDRDRWGDMLTEFWTKFFDGGARFGEWRARTPVMVEDWEPFTLLELKLVLSRMKADKCTGDDGVSAELLKHWMTNL